MCIIHLRKYSSLLIKIESTRKQKKMLKSDKSEPKKNISGKGEKTGSNHKKSTNYQILKCLYNV